MLSRCPVYWAWLVLVLPLLLLQATSTLAIPYKRHLLQLSEPYQTPNSLDHNAPSTASPPLDPYSKLLEQTIQRQSSLDEAVAVESLAGEVGDSAGGRRVSVDASRDGTDREVDMDNMTARSPALKSLEEDEDEGLNAMIAWDVTLNEDHEESPQSPAPTQPAVDGRNQVVDQMTTPAAHPSYQMDSAHHAQPQPWQSPMLDEEPEEKDRGHDTPPEASLLSLVEDQMSSYFPSTGGEAGGSVNPLGHVRQSLATALRQDIASLIQVFSGKGQSVVDKVHTLYEDYDLKKTQSKPDNKVKHNSLPETSDVKTSSISKTGKTEKQPIDLKTFFAKYDFEVDADMMQEKILDIYQQSSSENTAVDKGEERKISATAKSDSTTHFHQAQPESRTQGPPGDAKVCTKSHDLRAIFRNLDFEVDADKMQEKLHQFHEMSHGTKVETDRVQQDAPKTAEKQADLKNFLSQFDFEVDADEVTTKLRDFHTNVSAEVSTQHTPADSYMPYFNAEEKRKYDEESLDEFYTRFFSLKGTVIKAVALSM